MDTKTLSNPKDDFRISEPGKAITQAIHMGLDYETFAKLCGSHSEMVIKQKWEEFQVAWSSVSYVLAGAIDQALTDKNLVVIDQQKQARREIERRNARVDRLNVEVRDIAKSIIPDFHWLDFAVSTFWSCDDSPVGMCVFHLNERGHKTQCRYCGGPTERK